MNRLVILIAPLACFAGTAHAQSADPHAGHTMSMPAQSQDEAQPTATDPHAGHNMHAMHHEAQDPHAGHDMTMPMAPPSDEPHTDDAGRSMQTPPPLSANTGPAHAADLIFGADAMTASRQLLLKENGDVRTTAVILDRIEAAFGDGADTYLWNAQGWSGGDINRFWWKSEGEGDIKGALHEVEIQALYSRAITPFWNLQTGLRQDFQPDGPDTTHAVLGVQGLAPYWWEVDAAAYLSTRGDLTASIEAEYDQRITQRLILQPRIEAALSASDIAELEIGSGLSSLQAGLRLRYEFTKEFAPYLGVEWSRAFGTTADYITARGASPDQTRFVIGLKAWF